MFKDIDPDKFRSGMRGVLAISALASYVGLGTLLAFSDARAEVIGTVLGGLGGLVVLAYTFFYKKEE